MERSRIRLFQDEVWGLVFLTSDVKVIQHLYCVNHNPQNVITLLSRVCNTTQGHTDGKGYGTSMEGKHK